jgi:MFS family permease
MMMPLPAHLAPFLALSFAAQVLSGLVGSCNAGLLASTVSERQRGVAAGWMNSGNLAGAALGAWLTLALSDGGRAPRAAIALLLFACILAPALAVLRVHEPAPPRRRLRARFQVLTSDVAATLRSRRGWICLVMCLSPVGSAALLNYATALAPDYRASPRLVAFISGPINALVVAAGALTCGHLSHRIDRRFAYLAAAGLTAACALGTMLAPAGPTTYAIGITGYLFASGAVYAAFSAMVLEAIGRAGRSAATQYQIFASAANASMLYVGLIDTRFHARWGSPGVLGADAILNLAGIVALLLLLRTRAARPPALAAAAAAGAGSAAGAGATAVAATVGSPLSAP